MPEFDAELALEFRAVKRRNAAHLIEAGGAEVGTPRSAGCPDLHTRRAYSGAATK